MVFLFVASRLAHVIFCARNPHSRLGLGDFFFWPERQTRTHCWLSVSQREREIRMRRPPRRPKGACKTGKNLAVIQRQVVSELLRPSSSHMGHALSDKNCERESTHAHGTEPAIFLEALHLHSSNMCLSTQEDVELRNARCTMADYNPEDLHAIAQNVPGLRTEAILRQYLSVVAEVKLPGSA